MIPSLGRQTTVDLDAVAAMEVFLGATEGVFKKTFGL